MSSRIAAERGVIVRGRHVYIIGNNVTRQNAFFGLNPPSTLVYISYVLTDGHLLAYTSNESGRYGVYVETFPDRSDRKVVVSDNGGGYEPR